MGQATSLRGGGPPPTPSPAGLYDPPVERRAVGLRAPSGERAGIGAPGGWIVEAYLGYRTWAWSTVDGRLTLRSVAATDPDQTDWFRGEVTLVPWPKDRALEARCLCTWMDGGVPMPGRHTCGIYAWRSPTFIGPHTHYLHGEVYLWGEEVNVHERGIRAGFAMPAAIYVSAKQEKRIQTASALAALQYDVPLVRVP